MPRPSQAAPEIALCGVCGGILIALISTAWSVAAWEVVDFSNPAVADHIFDKEVEDLKASGAPQEEIDKTAREVEAFKKLYANPFANAGFTFLVPFPVGLLMTLLSAAILRRK